MRFPGWRACAVLLLVVGACSPSNSGERDEPVQRLSAEDQVTLTIAGAEETPIRLPDFAAPADLEQALVAFGECVEESFPIVMRFQTDPFVGLFTDVGSQRQEDGELVESTVAGCKARLDLDRRLVAYQVANPISLAQEQALADDFIACATPISAQVAQLVSEADLDTQESIVRFEISLGDADLSPEELVAVSECQLGVLGPLRVFREGHSWFVP